MATLEEARMPSLRDKQLAQEQTESKALPAKKTKVEKIKSKKK